MWPLPLCYSEDHVRGGAAGAAPLNEYAWSAR